MTGHRVSYRLGQVFQLCSHSCKQTRILLPFKTLILRYLITLQLVLTFAHSMDGKTTCYLDGGVSKKFELFPDTQLEDFGRKYFKIERGCFVVVCLTPWTEQSGFSGLIDKVPQQVPAQLYFYSVPKEEELRSFRMVTVKDTSNALETQYKFRMLVSDTFKGVDSKFKTQRDPFDKMPFSYIVQGQQQPLATSLSQFPRVDIEVTAIPKLTTLQVFENGEVLLTTNIATTLFKKNARELFQKIVAPQLGRDDEQFGKYKIFFEYNNTKGEQIAPKPGEFVKLHFNYKTVKPQQDADVGTPSENGDQRRRESSLDSGKHKEFSYKPPFTLNQMQPQQEQSKTTAHNSKTETLLEHPELRQKTSTEVANAQSRESRNYSQASPQVPRNAQLAEWVKFKEELKVLVNLPNSEENDAKIKHLIANHMHSRLCC